MKCFHRLAERILEISLVDPYRLGLKSGKMFMRAGLILGVNVVVLGGLRATF